MPGLQPISPGIFVGATAGWCASHRKTREPQPAPSKTLLFYCNAIVRRTPGRRYLAQLPTSVAHLVKSGSHLMQTWTKQIAEYRHVCATKSTTITQGNMGKSDDDVDMYRTIRSGGRRMRAIDFGWCCVRLQKREREATNTNTRTQPVQYYCVWRKSDDRRTPCFVFRPVDEGSKHVGCLAMRGCFTP